MEYSCKCWCGWRRCVNETVLFFYPHFEQRRHALSCYTQLLQPLPTHKWFGRARMPKEGGCPGEPPGIGWGPKAHEHHRKISANFINFCPLKKLKFQPLRHASLPDLQTFEHCIQMGSQNIELLHSTLCLSIWIAHFTSSNIGESRFHLNTFQFSICSKVLYAEITADKDYTWKKNICQVKKLASLPIFLPLSPVSFVSARSWTPSGCPAATMTSASWSQSSQVTLNEKWGLLFLDKSRKK